MNRVGRLLICIAGGVALSVTARGDIMPVTSNGSALRQDVNPTNRPPKTKRHYMNLPKGFPGFSQMTAPAINRPAAGSPQSFKRPGLSFIQPNPSLAPVAVTPAPDNTLSGNPYASIVTRNVFGLNPIPPSQPVETPAGPPPPKITLTGITTIFGPPEALFKVAGVVRNGKPPQDESYIFTEGEEQDEVEVTKIDTTKNIVSFMNHGVQQDIPLTDGVASGGTAPSAPSWPGQPGMRKVRRFGAFGGNPGGGFQTQSYNSSYGGGNNGSQNANGAYNGNGQQSNYHDLGANISPAISQLSDEDQQALVAAAHAQAVQDNNPNMPPGIFPPTQFDPQAGVPPQGTPGDAVPQPQAPQARIR